MDRRSGGLDEARWNFVIRVLCIYCSAMQNLHTTIGLLFSLKNSMCLEEQCPEEQTNSGCPRYWYLEPRVLPHPCVYVLNRHKSIVLTARNTASIIAMLLKRRSLRKSSMFISYLVNVVVFLALRRALAVRVFLRRFHLIYRPPGPLDWTPPSGRGSRLDRRGRQHGFGRGKSEEAYSRLGYSRIISGQGCPGLGTARRQKCVSHLP